MYYSFTGKLPGEKEAEYWAGYIEKDSRSDFRKRVTDHFSERSGEERKNIINNVF